MAISPIAGAIYANQVAPQASVIQADQQAKIDMQNAMAAALANEKNKEITEVRATEETYHVDPDNEHEKEKSSQEQSEKNSENSENSELENSENSKPKGYEHAELLSAKELEERLEILRKQEEESQGDEDKPAFLNLSV